MAKKSLGYVELEWTCPNCSTRNPGSRKTCLSCGMPQPEDVEFHQPAQEKLIEDEAKLEQAEAGPDVHCYYCGSRNPATAKTCSQCGADLSQAGQRESGSVLGAHRSGPAKPITCPACGKTNAPDAPKCVQCGASLTGLTAEAPPPLVSPPAAEATPSGAVGVKSRSRFGIFGGITGVIILLVICAVCGAFVFLSSSTEDITGTVQEASWSRTIVVEGQVPVERETWHDEIPTEGVRGVCTQKVRRTQDQPAANSREICGTPYTVDTGSGFGEVVQDCRYQVYEDFCKYTVKEWQEVDEVTLRGEDYAPRWPDPPLRSGRREKEREERYRIEFSTPEGEYAYITDDLALFNRAQIGSEWILEVNGLNTVTDIEPAQ